MEYVLILFIVALIAVALLAARVSESFAPYPYQKRTDSFYSATEESFLSLLEQACGDRYRVFTKVRLGDVVAVRTQGLSAAAKRDAQQKVNNRILDYVLCDKTNMRVVGVIELEPVDPSSHQLKRNWFLKNTLAAAGLPFLRFKARPGYRPDELGEFIQAKLRQSDYVRAAGPGRSKNNQGDAALAS
ncbi:hypothetical protein CWE15_05965 [Aliidiomarina taiwanensis]|uniref:DUF2726 domain-containing protein n=2 Tax=Aliidiomarina taiwanensis TaxID=946228 RepID=A0A432X7X2_9GAMM|nr:hypothetical protein CWE15_05965 [Aliidiomarina taiwanensis]